MKPETSTENPKHPTALPPARGSAAGCSKREIWPLMMAVGFTCMAKSNGMTELILRAVTIAVLTYSISHRLCRRQNDKVSDAPDSAAPNRKSTL